MYKKGVSAVFATVLIVLMVAVGVGFVWVFVIPMISEGVNLDFNGIKLDIVAFEGYTFYDNVEKFAFVQVKRGDDDLDIYALDIVFYIDGDSVTYRVFDVVESGNFKHYYFDFDGDGVVGVPSEVSIAAALGDGNSDVLSRVDMPTKNNSFDSVRWTEILNGAGNNNLKGVVDLCGGAVSDFIPVGVDASSYFDDGSTVRPPNNAIDDDLSTIWQTASLASPPQWASFDLGEKKCIAGFNFYSNVLAVGPISMKLEVSDDGVTWTDAPVSSFVISQPVNIHWENIVFDSAVSARYVRVNYESFVHVAYASEVRFVAGDIS